VPPRRAALAKVYCRALPFSTREARRGRSTLLQNAFLTLPADSLLPQGAILKEKLLVVGRRRLQTLARESLDIVAFV
jgi:hypothetical protein